MKKSGMSAKSFVCIMALAISFGFLSGCDEDSGGGSSDSSGTATGPTTVINPSASGTYTVDFNDLTIIINLTSFVSDTYVCDGPSGQMDLIILGIDETLLRLYDPEEDDET